MPQIMAQATTETQPNPLVKAGYRVFFWDGSLFVHKPNSRDHYMINPYAKTCGCYAGRHGKLCKHVRNLLDLVWASLAELSAKHRYDDVDALSEYWWQFACAVRKGQAEGIPQYLERIEAEALAERKAA